MEAETAAIPARIQEWEDTLNSRKAELEELNGEVEERKKAQRHLERQLDQKQVDLSKYNTQLPLIKTNREYKAILVEIDMVEKDISDLEEEILAKMDDVEEVEGRAREKREELRRAEEETAKERQKLEDKQKALEESLRGTRSQRENLAADVESSLLTQYDRIRTRKEGLALTRISGESCDACHMALPPQIVNEVIGGRVKSCPSCLRLLYWDEV